MSFTSLPPELLLDIIEMVGGDLPSRDERQYKFRRANLRSLSLVNSFFRPVAQDLLSQEFWRIITFEKHESMSQLPPKGDLVTHCEALGPRCFNSDGMGRECELFDEIRTWSNLIYLGFGKENYAQILNISVLLHFPRTLSILPFRTSLSL